MLRRVLEEDGYQVACALDIAAALPPLYLNPFPLVVVVDGASARVDRATLDLIAADLGPLGRHRYLVLAGPERDESLWAAESPLAFLYCTVVHKPVTSSQIRELVARYAPRRSASALDLTEMDIAAS
jgi:hypothetical protein